jgi:predicted acetyltransferase
MDKKHLDDCYRLWKQCFEDSNAYMDYYFREKAKDNHILTLYEGQDLISMIHLNPYLIFINGVKLEVNYIVGVATDKDYRNQGRMRTLMIDAMKEMYQEKQCFAYLMPAAAKIYKPYDFKYIYFQDRMSLTIETKESDTILQAASIQTSNRINSIEVNSLDAKDEKELKKIAAFTNRKLKENFNIFTVRSGEYYIRLIKEMRAAGGDVLTFYRSGRLIGIISYMMDDDMVEVTESIISKEYTRLIVDKLFSWLLNIVENSIRVTFLESYFLDEQVLKIQYPQIYKKQQAIIMARIIHLQEFFKLFSISRDLTKVIEVKDNIVEENNGVWKLYFSPNGCHAEKTDEIPERSMTISQIMDYFLKNAKIYINEIV